MTNQSEDRTSQYPVRLPNGMRDRVKAVAKKNKRSMNAELNLAIEAWLEQVDQKEKRETVS